MDAPVPENAAARTLVNLTELAELLEISLPTARTLMREPGFPVERVGTNGVPYEFDAAAVAQWQKAYEDRLEQERKSRAEQIKQFKLNLFGGISVDPESLGLSPKDQAAAFAAEFDATRIARLRGELVDAEQVKQCAVGAFTVLRQELLDIGNHVGRLRNLDREARAAIDTAIEQALKRAAERLSNPTSYGDAAAA